MMLNITDQMNKILLKQKKWSEIPLHEIITWKESKNESNTMLVPIIVT